MLVVEATINAYSFSLQSKNIFRFLFHEKKVSDVYVFQWYDNIIVSVGQDYSYVKKMPRVAAKMISQQLNIRLEIFDGGMNLFVEENLVDSIKDSLINIPEESNFRLKLGDFSSLRRGWVGEISNLNISYIGASSIGPGSLFKAEFNSKEKSVKNIIFSDKNILVIPNYPVFYDRELFVLPYFKLNAKYFFDFFINFLGFIPFGFFIMFFVMISTKNYLSSFFISILVVFMMSFFVEFVQSWLPTRTSSALDLLLNVFGGFLGCFFVPKKI